MKAQQSVLLRSSVFVVLLLVAASVSAVSVAAQAPPVAPAAPALGGARLRAYEGDDEAMGRGGVVQSTDDLQGVSVTKTVTPTGQVEYGDELTYTLVISAAPGVQVGLYDPLTDTTFVRFVEHPPVGIVTHADSVVTGTLTITPTTPVTVSFVVRVDFPGTLEWRDGVANRACVYPFGGTLGGCVWSNEVVNPFPHKLYLPIIKHSYALMQADFTAWPTAGTAPLTVVFTNTSTGGYTISLWDFGDGVTSTQTSPTHTYTAIGAYTVTLTVSKVSGTPLLPGDTSTLVRPNYIIVQENMPPYEPSDPAPATGAISQSVDVGLSWTSGDPDGDVVTYTIYLEADDDTPDLRVFAGQSAAYDPGTLAADTHYYWQIIAVDEHGETTTGPVWDFTTSAEVPPMAPSHLQATPVSSSQIKLDWQDNASDESGFTIYDGSIWVANIEADATSYTVGGMESDSYHCFRVYAFNDYGMSGWSNWGCATTLSSGACAEGIANGGFEYDSDWELPLTRYPAVYTTVITRSGNRSARTGIADSGDNRESYSSVRQTIIVPADTISATLSFWLYPVSGEPPANLALPARPLASTIERAVLASDRQYVIVLNQYDEWINTLVWQRKDDEQWTFHQFDLTTYAGRTIKLQFGTYNDGWDGVTAMYVDDVSLELCTSTARARPGRERNAAPAFPASIWLD